MLLASCFTVKTWTKEEYEKAVEEGAAEKKEQQAAELEERNTYITGAETAFQAIRTKTDPSVFAGYIDEYYNGDIYFFLYEPALLKIGSLYTGSDQTVHFVHNRGVGLNPVELPDTSVTDNFVPADLYFFDSVVLLASDETPVGNLIPADVSGWGGAAGPEGITEPAVASSAAAATLVYLQNVPDSLAAGDVLRYAGLHFTGMYESFSAAVPGSYPVFNLTYYRQ
jgi:hypothetical protein